MASGPLYDEALSYRYYSLQDTSQKIISRATGNLKYLTKRLDFKLKRHHFNGEDPIRVIGFLRRFTKEADKQLMSEAQAYLALPDFLVLIALSQYEAFADAADPENGGVTCWPEAMNYLLRAHSTSTATG